MQALTKQQVIEQLLSSEGYQGHRIDESNYSRMYEGGAYVPQYRDADGRWHSYFSHTRNSASAKGGMRSYNSTGMTYKTVAGAYGFLVKKGYVA